MRRKKIEPTPTQPDHTPEPTYSRGPTAAELDAAVQRNLHPRSEPHLCLSCARATDSTLTICRRCHDNHAMPNPENFCAQLMGYSWNTWPADLLKTLNLTFEQVLEEANKMLTGEATWDDINYWLCLRYDEMTLEPTNPYTITYPMIPQGDWKDAPMVRSTSARIDPTPADKITWVSAPRPPSKAEQAAALAANEQALSDRRRLVQEQHLARAEVAAKTALKELEEAKAKASNC